MMCYGGGDGIGVGSDLLMLIIALFVISFLVPMFGGVFGVTK